MPVEPSKELDNVNVQDLYVLSVTVNAANIATLRGEWVESL